MATASELPDELREAEERLRILRELEARITPSALPRLSMKPEGADCIGVDFSTSAPDEASREAAWRVLAATVAHKGLSPVGWTEGVRDGRFTIELHWPAA